MGKYKKFIGMNTSICAAKCVLTMLRVSGYENFKCMFSHTEYTSIKQSILHAYTETKTINIHKSTWEWIRKWGNRKRSFHFCFIIYLMTMYELHGITEISDLFWILSWEETFTSFVRICYLPRRVCNTTFFRLLNQDFQSSSQDSKWLLRMKQES
jgi:hypothetical protein